MNNHFQPGRDGFLEVKKGVLTIVGRDLTGHVSHVDTVCRQCFPCGVVQPIYEVGLVPLLNAT